MQSDEVFDPQLVWVYETIDTIEKHKHIVRHEYEELKESYNDGSYRKVYGTKADTMNRMQRLLGEITGHEYALTYLYRRQTELEGTDEG